MNYTEIKDKSKVDLQKLIKDKEQEMFELRLKHKTMQLSSTAELKNLRRDIARIKTALSSIKG